MERVKISLTYNICVIKSYFSIENQKDHIIIHSAVSG